MLKEYEMESAEVLSAEASEAAVRGEFIYFSKSVSQSRDTVKCVPFRPVLRRCSSVSNSVSFFSHNWSCLVRGQKQGSSTA
jgi:hypothetical protein